MKKIIQLLALFVCFTAAAQNFPGEKIELLNGKNLRVLPVAEILQKYGYKDFYTDASLKEIYKKEGYSTSYNALVNKKFKVISYESYKTSSNELKYKLLIENQETGKLYFDYHPEYSFTFPFEVIGGLDFPEGYFCYRIEEKGSTDLKYYTSPIEEGVQFLKNSSDNILVTTIGFASDEVFYPKKVWKGLTIVFDNGATISLPNEKLTTAVSGTGKTILKASVILEKAEHLALMKGHEMKTIKFGTLENTLHNGRLLNEFYKCILKK